MIDATDLARAIAGARHGLGWVSAAVLERGDDDETAAIERIAGALGITQPIGWRRIAIEPHGRRLLADAIAYSLAYGGQEVPLAKAEGFVDQLLRVVPGSKVAVTNVGHDFDVRRGGTWDPLTDRRFGVALILVGPTHAGGIAIEEID